MSPPRRHTDPDDEDYQKLRGGSRQFNGHTKWIVGVVGTLGVAALIAFANRDRMQIDREQIDQNGRLSTLEKSMATLATTVASSNAIDEAFRQEIRSALAEIKADVKEVKREVRR